MCVCVRFCVCVLCECKQSPNSPLRWLAPPLCAKTVRLLLLLLLLLCTVCCLTRGVCEQSRSAALSCVSVGIVSVYVCVCLCVCVDGAVIKLSTKRKGFEQPTLDRPYILQKTLNTMHAKEQEHARHQTDIQNTWILCTSTHARAHTHTHTHTHKRTYAHTQSHARPITPNLAATFLYCPRGAHAHGGGGSAAAAAAAGAGAGAAVQKVASVFPTSPHQTSQTWPLQALACLGVCA